ncbi:hypothetical protein CRENBAI_009322 [Crenichthys baileyi]|uniref:Uncharacterized protein n=1 Tax=Crenichthys baileyi TaxID=28760 RepID=A0AAV9S848_9TELE
MFLRKSNITPPKVCEPRGKCVLMRSRRQLHPDILSGAFVQPGEPVEIIYSLSSGQRSYWMMIFSLQRGSTAVTFV